ncbi:hypothetical protein QBC47DRAFT_418173 [Echria macrotheca]|uniref:Uncharacterized protein n=1 Tax=Echria macrotheca TaxID=438768 RepID=A0AAJ0B2D5_9PEZI|nr:hypothetical protein QBC47DRAFT_418173 [Echria macrotheca]
MLQQKIPPTPPDTNLAGQTVIVTGGNAGLGLETARQLLVLGASRMIVACRSVSRGEEAVATLRADAQLAKKNPDAIIEVFELDLDDYASALRFTDRVKKDVKELDILLNNGGISVPNFETSKSGHERTMQVNCYTYALICLELLPLLRSTAALRGRPTRITFVGSNLHVRGTSIAKTPIPAGRSVMEHFDDPARFSKLTRYGDSKLGVAALTRRLATLAPDEVVVNHMCPGMVSTAFDKNQPLWIRAPMVLVRGVMARDVEEGARAIVYAAAVAGPETNGKFVRNNAVEPGSLFLDKPEGGSFIDGLWKDVMKDIVKLDPSLESYVSLNGSV